MTFNEGWIYVFKGGAGTRPDPSRSDLSKFAQLQSGAGNHPYWVPYVEEWAKSYGIETHYKDNCWLFVVVAAADLREFLRKLEVSYTCMAWIPTVLERVRDDDAYLIEAEEY